MKKRILALVVVMAFCVIGGPYNSILGKAIAQVVTAYESWPLLHAAAQKIVIKRGTDEQGEPTDTMYVRNDWGPCLTIGINRWPTFIAAIPSDRYMNLRDYADEVYHEVEDVALYKKNCPRPSLELQPTWRKSRPTYYWKYDEVAEQWVKGSKSPYRVKTDGPVSVPCDRQNAKKGDGISTNFWRLNDSAIVYNSAGDHTLGDLGFDYGLLAICHETDADIEALIF